jgi:hypothetical protein
LELAVTLTAETGGEIKFLLVGAASAKAKGETVSRIKLSFGPIPIDQKTGKQVISYGPVALGDAHPLHDPHKKIF